MPSGMGHGVHGWGIDEEVVSESSLAKIVPKLGGGWKDGWGQFDRGRLRALCWRPESRQLVVQMGVKLALPGQFGHCQRKDCGGADQVGRRLCSAGDNRHEEGCLRR